MDSELMIEGVREALRIALLMAAPLLSVVLVVGLVIGLMQAMTQLQDPTVSLIPRMLAVALAVLVFLPWIVGTWTSYAAELFSAIPGWL
jgi:flagellar biosynthetic protein FliQ